MTGIYQSFPFSNISTAVVVKIDSYKFNVGCSVDDWCVGVDGGYPHPQHQVGGCGNTV